MKLINNRSLLSLVVAAAVFNVQAADRVLATPEIFNQSMTQANTGSSLQLVTQRQLHNGTKISRYQQNFQGVPIWDQKVVRQIQSGFLSNPMVSGEYVTNITKDLQSATPKLSSSQAQQTAIDFIYANRLSNRPINLENHQEKLWIKLNQNNKAELVYLVSWVTIKESGDPSRPHVFVNAQTGKVIDHWEGINFQEATGPGGNEKVGRYEYGTDFPTLEVDSNCRMSTDNVDTIDMNNRRSGGSIFQFDCPNNDSRFTNGAYSPLNDGHYFGNVVFNMYESWYNTAPITQKLRMRVHYGNNYENAFWDGRQMTFGDGGSRLHPLVSLDVSAHEVSHGFTEQNSSLVYRNQPGGINEAFSDMAGEAAKFFMTGTNDWLVGSSIFKDASALRYFEDPTLDGRSIGNAEDYTNGMDVHFSSGVFNRAFFLIATSDGWDTRKAFDIFVLANQIYWSQNTNYISGACGAIQAAESLDYPLANIASAFTTVGVDISSCYDGGGDDGGGDDGGDDGGGDDNAQLEKGVAKSGLAGSQGDEAMYTLEVPANVTDLSFQLSGGTGDADMYVRFGSAPTTDVYDCRPYRNGNNETCSFESGQEGTYYVMLRGYRTYSGASLVANFTVGDDGGGDDGGGDDNASISASGEAGSFLFWRWVDISWSSDTIGSVDVYRNGERVASGITQASYRDRGANNGSNEYQVCEADSTSVCSDSFTVSL